MGTDWRDNDPQVEPVVEIYQGDRQNYEMPDAPAGPTATADSIGGWRPWASSRWPCKKATGWGSIRSVERSTSSDAHVVLQSLGDRADARRESWKPFPQAQRRIYRGSTDNILADVRCGAHPLVMGEEFSVNAAPVISVKLVGTAPFAKVRIVKDNNYVYSVEPKTSKVSFTWKDDAAVKGTTSYYYLRGEQEDGQLVWVSPMWISYSRLYNRNSTPMPDTLVGGHPRVRPWPRCGSRDYLVRRVSRKRVAEPHTLDCDLGCYRKNDQIRLNLI